MNKSAIPDEVEFVPHPDDVAIDRFSDAMKAKMAAQREKAYGGWETCPIQNLQGYLQINVRKGDPVDVGNFAMMLFNLNAQTSAQVWRPSDNHLVVDELPLALTHLSEIVHALVNTCADLHRVSQAREAKLTLPQGWVALSTVWDEDREYPEEIAYGPPDMMARLGKKMDKYYTDLIANRDVAQYGS